MTFRRRTRLIIAVVLHVLAAVIIVMVVRTKVTHDTVVDRLAALGSEAKLAIERWCGSQLLAIARGYLNPDLSFDVIQYEYPATVTLTNVKLVSEGVTFVNASMMRVELTERPIAGQPLVIQSVKLTDPVVRLILKPQGGLVGFSNLIRKRGDSADVESIRKANDVFAIRQLAIVNGTLEYHVPQRVPMILDQLTFELASTPAHESDISQAGWYSINALFAREPQFRWKMDGGINIDSGVLRFDQSKVNMHLVPQQYGLLPPAVQEYVRAHEMTGHVEGVLDGKVPLRKGAPLQLALNVNLMEGRMAFGNYVLPVDQFNLVSRFSEDQFSIQSFDYRGLGGQVNVIGSMKLHSPYPAEATIDAHDLRIEQTMRASAASQTQLQGKMNLNGTASGELAAIDSTAAFTGRVSVTEGRLVEIPIISSLIRTVKLSGSSSAGSDRASADLQLAGDRLLMKNLEVLSGPMGASGDGHVRFDSTIDFRIRAGPFQGLRNSLGGVGDALNTVTNGLVVYDVKGTLNEPIVTLRPLGIGGSQNRAR